MPVHQGTLIEDAHLAPGSVTFFNFDNDLRFPKWQPLRLQNLQTTFGRISASGDARIRFNGGTVDQRTNAALAIANGSAQNALSRPGGGYADMIAVRQMLLDNFRMI